MLVLSRSCTFFPHFDGIHYFRGSTARFKFGKSEVKGDHVVYALVSCIFELETVFSLHINDVGVRWRKQNPEENGDRSAYSGWWVHKLGKGWMGDAFCTWGGRFLRKWAALFLSRSLCPLFIYGDILKKFGWKDGGKRNLREGNSWSDLVYIVNREIRIKVRKREKS